MRTLRNFTTNTTTTSAPPPQGQHAPWHSPVPYLFGGLAAMLGLIAFALLILACSYWKLSGYLDGGDSGDRDTNDSSAETNSSDGGDAVKPPPVFEEKILVIMAGQLNPTFVATPICSRASSLNNGNSSSKEETTSSDKADAKVEDGKQEGCVQVEMGSMQNHGGADQGP